ncbi:hypothetical protein Pla100_41100 [Neorhodopirellula pilleata]|uniref:Uncharacterized protein n=1 Tax=Neorhodopirellula pilleata TaxID=2714738 RepID=A0A5C6A186_9BACT|nr:hypothetical protein Pla100_41100 [Neorhodopirellula pilleata]
MANELTVPHHLKAAKPQTHKPDSQRRVDLGRVWAFSFNGKPQAPAFSNSVACGLPLNDSVNRPASEWNCWYQKVWNEFPRLRVLKLRFCLWHWFIVTRSVSEG